MEAMQKKDTEVLFCYENYDELVLMNLAQFDKKYLKSVENELVEDKSDTSTVDAGQYKWCLFVDSLASFILLYVWYSKCMYGMNDKWYKCK